MQRKNKVHYTKIKGQGIKSLSFLFEFEPKSEEELKIICKKISRIGKVRGVLIKKKNENKRRNKKEATKRR